MSQPSNNPVGDGRFYNQISSKGAVVFIAVIAGGFGAMCLLGALQKGFSRLDADKLLILFLGLVILVNAGLFLRFTLGARVILTADELILRKWLGAWKWRFSDITGLASFQKMIQPRAYGSGVHRKLGPEIPIQNLVIKSRDGRISSFVLPEFRGNARLLESLAAKTRLEIHRLKDGEADLEEWKTRVL